MTSATDIDALLRSTGALLSGHFRLASGRHSGTYIEKFRLMEQPEATRVLCAMIARHFRDSGVELVAGPAMGGVILAYETAGQLGVRDIFAEKAPSGGLFLGRGFSIQPRQRVLIVDDVLTTGGSVKQLLTLLRSAGADIAGVGCLVDRTDGAVDFGVPFFACRSLDIPSYPEEACPLCEQGLPLIET